MVRSQQEEQQPRPSVPTIYELLAQTPSAERVARLRSMFVLDDPTAGPEVLDWMAMKEARQYGISYNSALGGIPIDEDRVDSLMKNVIDVHVHGGSDPFQRLQLEDELACQFTEAGLRALVIKTWYTPSASRVSLVQRVVDKFAEKYSLRPSQVYGGITLNYSVGGFNRAAVEACVGFPGMKFVWFPMIDSRHHRRMIFDDWSGHGLTYIDDGGKVIPEVKEILRVIADNDLVLATGHYSYEDSARLIDEARSVGVERISIVHPSLVHTRHTIPQMKEQVERGAKLEFRAKGLVSFPAEIDPLYTVEMINEVGAHNFVLGSDWGQVDNIPQLVGIRWALKKLIAFGITEDQIRAMTVEAPARLLGLPPIADDQDVPQIPRSGSGVSRAVSAFVGAEPSAGRPDTQCC